MKRLSFFLLPLFFTSLRGNEENFYAQIGNDALRSKNYKNRQEMQEDFLKDFQLPGAALYQISLMASENFPLWVPCQGAAKYAIGTKIAQKSSFQTRFFLRRIERLDGCNSAKTEQVLYRLGASEKSYKEITKEFSKQLTSQKNEFLKYSKSRKEVVDGSINAARIVSFIPFATTLKDGLNGDKAQIGCLIFGTAVNGVLYYASHWFNKGYQQANTIITEAHDKYQNDLKIFIKKN